MKKKLLVLASLALAALLLSACGRKTVAPVNVTAAPAPAAEPAPVQTPAPAPTLEPTPMITPAPAPTLEPTPMVTPAPAPTATPAPAPTATPAPTASNLPKVTKDPTGETVDVGGKCQFVTRYENAKWAEWHFVSPDGTQDLDYVQAEKAFPTMKIINGGSKDLTLDKIPETLNGWKVYCRFSNDYGAVKSDMASITVRRGSGSSTPAPANYPRVTKDPTDEKVAANGKCQFVTRYENAKLAEWHFVSPDGRDITYAQAQKEFPTLKIKGGNTKDMTLDSIPEGLNGWRVYCRFSNDNGSVNSGSALITIQGAKAPAAQRAGFEGRWAEEIAGRCQIVFKYRGEGSMNVDISWSSSAWERARWNMTANVYKNDIMVYNNAHYWVETYTDESHFTTSQDSYNGTGSFYLQDGKLHWANDQTGEDTVFVPA